MFGTGVQALYWQISCVEENLIFLYNIHVESLLTRSAPTCPTADQCIVWDLDRDPRRSRPKSHEVTCRFQHSMMCVGNSPYRLVTIIGL